MKTDKLELYEKVSDLISKDKFEQKISRYNKEFGGLIDEHVLAHLVIDELGRNISVFKTISELKPGVRTSLFVIVSKPEPKIFVKQKGTPKAAELYVSDRTGRVRLLLWDPHHVELIEKNEINVDTKLKLVNVKIVKSAYGFDLSLDKFESLVIDPNDFPLDDGLDTDLEIIDINNITEDGPVNIIGTVAKKSPLRSFNRKDRSKGYVLNVDLYDGTGTIRLTLWDEHAKAAEDFSIGDQIKIINGYSKLHNSQREIQTSYRTEILRIN